MVPPLRQGVISSALLIPSTSYRACGVQFTGEARTTPKRRSYGYKSTVNTQKLNTCIGHHLTRQNHPISDKGNHREAVDKASSAHSTAEHPRRKSLITFGLCILISPFPPPLIMSWLNHAAPSLLVHVHCVVVTAFEKDSASEEASSQAIHYFMNFWISELSDGNISLEYWHCYELYNH